MGSIARISSDFDRNDPFLQHYQNLPSFAEFASSLEDLEREDLASKTEAYGVLTYLVAKHGDASAHSSRAHSAYYFVVEQQVRIRPPSLVSARHPVRRASAGSGIRRATPPARRGRPVTPTPAHPPAAEKSAGIPIRGAPFGGGARGDRA